MLKRKLQISNSHWKLIDGRLFTGLSCLLLPSLRKRLVKPGAFQCCIWHTFSTGMRYPLLFGPGRRLWHKFGTEFLFTLTDVTRKDFKTLLPLYLKKIACWLHCVIYSLVIKNMSDSVLTLWILNRNVLSWTLNYFIKRDGKVTWKSFGD